MSNQAARTPAQRALWKGLRLVVVDTETTGLTTTSRVVSVAMVELANGRFGNSSAWLVNPGLRTVPQAHRHGLDAEALAGAPPFGAIAEEVVLRLTAGSGERVILTGFNVAFDARMLQAELAAVGRSLPAIEMLDVADLANHVGLVFAPRSLAGLLNTLQERNPAEHTELGDAVSTAKAALVLLDRLLEADDPHLDPVVVPLDPATLGRRRSRRQRPQQDPAPLSAEHLAAHQQPMTEPDIRRASLDVCLREGCEELAARMEDGISTPLDAADVLDWSMEHALGTELPRRLLGRLLAGIGQAAVRAEDRELARRALLDLAEPLQQLGPCTPEDRCGRCEHTTDTCRFDQVRQRLVQAFLLVSVKPNKHDTVLDRADTFLHLPRLSSRGQPRRGFYAELREAGEHDAAGYGAYLTAVIRRRVPDRDWALRTLERAWDHGSRSPHLAEMYASMLVTDRPARDLTRYAAALEVCDTTLRLQGNRNARVWRQLTVRKTRLQPLAANPPKAKPRLPVSRRRNKRGAPPRRLSLD